MLPACLWSVIAVRKPISNKECVMSNVFFTEELTVEEDMNTYKAVLLASKEARRLNKARLVAGVPEGEEKITTIALDRIVEKKIQVTYADGKEDSAGR